MAVRVPDNCYMVQANGYRIAEFDPKDAENVICSPGFMEFIQEKGLWNPADESFHFARTFGGKMTENQETEFFNSRRVWGAIRHLNPSMEFDPHSYEYPLFIRPECEITLETLTAILRDRFDGTSYDAFPASGGTGSDRPICVPSCVHSNVIQLRGDMPADIGAVLWGALGTPHTAPYLPYHFGVQSLPEEYLAAGPSFDPHSAFWHFRSLSELVLLDFSRLYPIVRDVWSTFEEDIIALNRFVEDVAVKVYAKDPDLARRYLTAQTSSWAYQALDRSVELGTLLRTNIAENMHYLFSSPGLAW